ncbi:MAG: hypothetical protein AAF337_13840 [Pseudomonadota bacterium]
MTDNAPTFLERKLGPFRLRVWGLVLNFAANVAALYGLTQYLNDGGGLGFLVPGALITLAMIILLSKPA